MQRAMQENGMPMVGGGELPNIQGEVQEAMEEAAEGVLRDARDGAYGPRGTSSLCGAMDTMQRLVWNGTTKPHPLLRDETGGEKEVGAEKESVGVSYATVTEASLEGGGEEEEANSNKVDGAKGSKVVLLRGGEGTQGTGQVREGSLERGTGGGTGGSGGGTGGSGWGISGTVAVQLEAAGDRIGKALKATINELRTQVDGLTAKDGPLLSLEGRIEIMYGDLRDLAGSVHILTEKSGDKRALEVIFKRILDTNSREY